MKKALAFTSHDHKRCRRATLATVEKICAERNIRLTPVRRNTLEILLETHTALGAYELLEKLSQSGFCDKPPVVYRALGFLMEQGFVHKLERHNAFVACSEPKKCKNPCFLICRACSRVAEQTMPAAHTELVSAANQAGFITQNSVIELSGLCAQCPSDS